MKRELNELNRRAQALKAGQASEGQALIAAYKTWAAKYNVRSQTFALSKVDLAKGEVIVLTWPASEGKAEGTFKFKPKKNGGCGELGSVYSETSTEQCIVTQENAQSCEVFCVDIEQPE
jgi:hypothetical protein